MTTIVHTITEQEEERRAAQLRDAEEKATAFFIEIVDTLIRPGVTEKQLSQEILQLGQQKHDIKTHWHKRIVRSGPNTLRPYADNPPDRTLEPGEMLIIDLGPVFEAWEADFGRSYIVPGGPAIEDDTDAQEKKKVVDALEPTWKKAREVYLNTPDMTAGQLYNLVVSMAKEDGWIWGAPLAGHIVGDFPHERIPNDKIRNYIVAENSQPLNSLDKQGRKLHWILEIYLRPQHEQYCGFFEQILTVP